MNDIVLASASPRRKELLQQLGFNPLVCPVDIDESAQANETVEDYVRRLAVNKSQAGHELCGHNLPVLGSDTIVVHHGQLLGKPIDADAAVATLRSLSGQSHQVFTSVAITWHGETTVLVSENQVTFAPISEAVIQAYVNSGEPMDKAGCYGIQGAAAMWIKHLSGSYSSVMGLPLYETAQLCQKLAIMMPLEKE